MEHVKNLSDQIIESSFSEVYVFDPETFNFIYVNKAARTNLGYTLEELSRLTPLDLNPEYSVEKFRNFIDPLLAQNSKSDKLIFETEYKRKDGSLYAVKVRLQKMEFDERILLVAVILDVGEKKRHFISDIAMQRTFLGIWEVDLKHGTFAVNARWQEMLGWEQNEFKNFISNREEYIHPDDLETLDLMREGSLNSAQGSISEFRIKHKAGHWIWVRSSASVLSRDPVTKQPLTLCGTILDITDRKHTELALRESEKRFQEFITHLPAKVHIKDLEGRIILINPVTEELLGVRNADAVGEKVTEIIPGEAGRILEANDREVIATNAPVVVEENFPSDLGVRSFLTVRFPMHDAAGEIVALGAAGIEITRRIAMESALREGESRLKAAQEIAKLGSWELDLESNIFSWSDEVYPILGLEARQSEGGFTYETFLEKVFAADRAMVDDVYSKSIKNYRGFDILHRLQLSSGIRYVRQRSEVRFDEVENPRCLIGIIQDVTELKQAELDLLQFKAAMDGSPNQCYITDFETLQFLYVNDASAHQTGYTKEELLTMGPVDIFKTDEKTVRRLFQDVIDAGGRGTITETPVRNKNGRLGFGEVHRRAMLQGERWVIITNSHDITARKNAEAALTRARVELEDRVRVRTQELQLEVERGEKIARDLQYSEKRFQDIASASADGFWETDENLNFTLIDVEFLAQMGVDQNAIPNLVHYKENSRKLETPEWQEYMDNLTNHRQFRNFQYGVRGSAGNPVFIKMSGVPVTDDDGQFKGYRGAISDITQEEMTKREASRAQEAMRAAKEEAEMASRAKSAFLANMSHEIRTPMNGVLGMIDLLSQTTVDDDQKKMIKTVHKSGQSLLAIINDILDFSKIEAGKLILESAPCDVVDIVESAAQALAPATIDKPVQIICDIDPDLPRNLLGDSVRLQQILTNLIGNAIKFTAAGEILVSAESVSSKIGDRPVIKFSVKDPGIGISEEAIQLLFKEFNQADFSTTRKFGGTGLGLVICKRLVELMGGVIGVHSSPGKGSTFYFEIPFATGNVEAAANGQDLAGIRVQVISQNQNYQEVCARLLKFWHADVAVERELQPGLQCFQDSLAKGKKFDMIVIPELDENGEEIVRRFLRSWLDTRIRIIIGRCPQKPGHSLGKTDGIIDMDINPLTQAGLITAVAVAAGRASPLAPMQELQFDIIHGRAPTPEEAQAAGKLILLAEDNLTNQDVIRRQLNRLGYTCDIANDGKEAYTMWRSKPYGLLLTDCHMPEWDGFDLTAAIRKDEEGTSKRSVIIAVTANALFGEAEKCKAGGMDDYLSKPLEIKKLQEKLQKWMGDGGVVMKQKAGKSNAGSQGDPINCRVLKDMFGEDDAVFKEILGSFVVTTKDIMEEINTAVHNRSTEQLYKTAHKLKSSARTVGADEMADLCLTLETAGKSDDLQTILELTPKLGPMYQKIKDFYDSL